MTQTTTPPIKEDVFLSKILQQRPDAPVDKLDRETGEWLTNVREQSASWVSRLSVPTKKDEEWRFTDIAEILDLDIVTPKLFNTKGEQPFVITEAENTRLVFVNGVYAEELSDTSGLPEGIYVGNLTNLPEAYCKYFRPFLGTIPGKEEVFTSLNTASISDVAIIWAAPNTVVEKPIHLLFVSRSDVSADSVTITQPRAWIVAERNCQLTIVEEYDGMAQYLSNSVTEVFLGENAQINHTRLQQEAPDAYHIGKTAVSQQRDSRYTLTEINLGGKLSRHSPQVDQVGEQTETNLNGLTVAKDKQTADTHSIIQLNHPHGTTDQLHKCLVSDRAHSVFNGKVFVPKPAQLTNASQLNRNLLLSPKARVDTKPELQITADNVKCSHGATVSQLEPDEIFYLRSRGLSEDDARQLLIDAFVTEIIERIPVESVRESIKSVISKQ